LYQFNESKIVVFNHTISIYVMITD